MLFTQIPLKCKCIPSIKSIYQYDKYMGTRLTQTISCAVTHTHTRQPESWVIHLWIRIYRLRLDESSIWSHMIYDPRSVLVLCIWMIVYFHLLMIVQMCVNAGIITLTCLLLHTCPGWHSQKLPQCLFPLRANQLVGHPPRLLACSPGRNAGMVETASGENTLKTTEETNKCSKQNLIIDSRTFTNRRKLDMNN